MPILADHPNARANRSRRLQKRRACGIQLADQPGHITSVGPKALWVIIEMRQIDQREIRLLRIQDFRSTARDPLGTRQTCQGAPKRLKWKWTKLALQALR